MKKKIIFISLITMIISIMGWFFILYGDNDNNSSLNIFFNPKMRRFVQILKIIQDSYYREITEEELIDNAIEGMLKELDPHSMYIYKKTDLENFNMSTTGKFGGIGFRVGVKDDRIVVISPIENTPASRAGLRAGDIILQIDSISTENMDINRAVSLMRGEPGTKVKLKIYRFGKTIDFDIIREMINVKSIPYYGMLDDTIAYIKILQFSDNLTEEFEKAMNELFYKKNAKKLILDLRGNPGGLLNEAINICDFFLPKGLLIVSTESSNESMRMEFKAIHPIYFGFFPLIILVDNGSASASEIVAGAVQDWDRGVIMGDTTYGKGSVQSVYDFEAYGYEQGILKFTTARYFTPSGRSIDRELIKYEREKDTILNKKNVHNYKSLGGLERTLIGGGGIIPDFIYQPDFINSIEVELLKKQTAFGFVAEYISKNGKLNNKKQIINLSESIINQYFEYLKENDIDIKKITDDEKTKNYVIRQLKLEFARQSGGDELFYEVYSSTDKLIGIAKKLMFEAENPNTLFNKLKELK